MKKFSSLYAIVVVGVITVLSWVSMFGSSSGASSAGYGRGSTYYGSSHDHK